MDNLTIFTVSSHGYFNLLRVPNPSRSDFLIAVSVNPDWQSSITVIVTVPHLHSPMYFFIGNLYLIHLCCISVTVPKMIVTSLTDNKLISLSACVAQIFMSILLVTTEFSFLVVMSYDCYVAICHPLHYGLIITLCLCAQAAGGGSWACGLVYFAIHTGDMFRLPFTESNVIQQYFCDIPQILRLSSSNVQISESVVLVIHASIFLTSSAFLFISYINVFSMVLKMHSVEVRNKALSTCTPQLAILILFIISGLTAHLGPTAKEASLINLLMAMFYAMVPPLINPIIYSLQNREINSALCTMFHRYF